MAIMTLAARVKIAQQLFEMPLHMALGLGGEGWGEAPPMPEYEATALVREIGRKSVFRKFYVEEDDAGEIVLPGERRFATSLTPTRHIYVQFLFDYGEGVGGAIRELGLFAGTVPKAGLPEGQMFFTPQDIADPGTLITLERPDTPDTFTPQKKGTYEEVITI